MNQGKFHDELASKERERLDARHLQDELNRSFLSIFRHRSEKRRLQDQLESLDKEVAELGALTSYSHPAIVT